MKKYKISSHGVLSNKIVTEDEMVEFLSACVEDPQTYLELMETGVPLETDGQVLTIELIPDKVGNGR